VLGVDTKTSQDPSGNGLVLADHSEQNVLGADVVIVAVQRLLQRQHEELLGPRRERDRTGAALFAAPDGPDDPLASLLQRDPRRRQRSCGNSLLHGQ
jgi:ABC-type molybdate transport system ATPase subunit